MGICNKNKIMKDQLRMVLVLQKVLFLEFFDLFFLSKFYRQFPLQWIVRK